MMKKNLSVFFLLILLLSNFVYAAQVAPVLNFPQAGMDDPARYKDYFTRFYRDSNKNALQIYFNNATGRVVNLWADSANESLSFSARGGPISWCSDTADTTAEGDRRFVEYFLCVAAPKVEIGHVLLGTMRKERDFQYFKKDLLPFDSEPFLEPELLALISNLEKLPAEEREAELKILQASSTKELRTRMEPVIKQDGTIVSVEQTSFDKKNLLWLELDAASQQVKLNSRSITITSADGRNVRLKVKVGTDSAPLTPLDRTEIFNSAFLNFYNEIQSRAAASAEAKTNFQWLDREVRGLELVSYQEKLMAGLPNFATYFGRDTMMSAFMFTPIWSDSMLEHAIESVLRKLSPRGDASHEEALGGQAIRENAGEYNKLVEQGKLPEGRAILSDLQKVRENYRMIDDDFQLPILIGRFLNNPVISIEKKRDFVKRRLTGVLKNFAYVCHQSQAYVEHPDSLHLVSFPNENGKWISSSWRDSGAGYAGGRFAMDVNVIYVPNALESIASSLQFLQSLGYTPQSMESQIQDLAPDVRQTFVRYAGNNAALKKAIEVWRRSNQHFWVRLNRSEYMSAVNAKIASLPEQEQTYWKAVLNSGKFPNRLDFLALSLDEAGKPIKILNTDPASLLFLENHAEKIMADREQPGDVYKLINPFLILYPVGLFIENLGSVCANDTNTSAAIWQSFEKDQYHSPRVVWGREENLFTLGLMKEIVEARKVKNANSYIIELQNALDRTRKAVEASGLKHNELWSYEIQDGKLMPVRYGTSSDIQLWNLTDLSIQFLAEQVKTK